ncbi:hypothetical protein AB0D49_41500 [Streptomyces sp. NPDC048290]|uniref:hypothetical protein n=1 Tax=Streptomyces sp. NPDC048290 TaxID=3155811 RepID=UPI003449EDEE
MTHAEGPARPPRPVPYMMDEEQARLTEQYTDAADEIRYRTPHVSITALLHAVHAHQARRAFACDPRWREIAGVTELPEDRADDGAAALALLRVARDDTGSDGEPSSSPNLRT